MAKVTVYIWKSNVAGEHTRATQAWRAGEANKGYVGHVAVSIADESGTEYISFWPTNGHNSPGQFSYLAKDCFSEGLRTPDATLEFSSLDTKKMRQTPLYQQYKKFLETKSCDLTWYGWLHLTQPANIKFQNCCTLAWCLLKAGGIDKLKPSLNGPKDKKLREFYKCDLGNLAQGRFDSAFWRKLMVTPQTMLHLVASAKEQEMLVVKKAPEAKSTAPIPIPSKL